MVGRKMRRESVNSFFLSTLHHQLSSKTQVAEEFLGFGVGEGFGEERMAEESAEFPLAGKGLEFGVIDNDGAGDGFSGVGVDGWLGGGRRGSCGDEFR